MGSFIKFIFYLAIIVIWILSNVKKQGKWEEEIPKFPEDFPAPSPSQTGKPQFEEPMEEGMQVPKEKTVSYPEEPSPYAEPSPEMTYEEKLAQQREKFIKKKVLIEQPALIEVAAEASAAPALPEQISVQPQAETIFQPYRLKSSIKEGIIWSIILGQPRSKSPFDRKFRGPR